MLYFHWLYHKYVCLSLLYIFCAIHCFSIFLICHNIDTAFLHNFFLLELFLHASYLLPFQTETVDSRKLHTKLWFVYRRITSMGENSIRSTTTLLQLIAKARERTQFCGHGLLAWLPAFALLSITAHPTSASTKASPYMSFHFFQR